MKTEKALYIILVIGILFKLLNWSGYSMLILVSLICVSIVYFPGSFYFFCDKTIKKQNLFLSIVSGLFLSLIPVGILFKLLHWTGGEIYLMTGAITSPIILAIVYFLKSKASLELKTYYDNMFLRTIVLSAISILFYILPM